jgi:hypothetical protein
VAAAAKFGYKRFVLVSSSRQHRGREEHAGARCDNTAVLGKVRQKKYINQCRAESGGQGLIPGQTYA